MKPVPFALAAALFGSAVLPVHAHDAADDMARAAGNFLASLQAPQKAKATFEWGADAREDWHFIPKDRVGLPLKEMTPEQRHLAYALLGTGLSNDGFAEATTIMSLEQILRDLEKDPVKRDPERYFFQIFGEPKAAGTWSWRCEGHHCSVNFTIVDGRISGTPSFFGANPGLVKEGPRAGLQALAAEEEAGRRLARELNPDQRKIAFLPGDVPKEILTEAKRRVDPLNPGGLAAATMTAEQKVLLRELIQTYTQRLRPEVAAVEWKQIEGAGFDAIHFAFIGGTDPGNAHYYRVQGPTFLIEYDNTQNGANHPHAVWREFQGDFGADLLAEHLKTSHPGK